MNLRTVANLLLAFSSGHKACRPFLGRYFSAAVRLPTDFTAVANLVQTFGGGKEEKDFRPPPGSLPAVLRRAMVDKFTEFDEYQLAKHNKGKAGKKVRANDERMYACGTKLQLQVANFFLAQVDPSYFKYKGSHSRRVLNVL